MSDQPVREANPRYKIDLSDLELPEAELGAKRLREFMRIVGYGISESASKEGYALSLGYKDWPDLIAQLGRRPELNMTPKSRHQAPTGREHIPVWGKDFYSEREIENDLEPALPAVSCGDESPPDRIKADTSPGIALEIVASDTGTGEQSGSPAAEDEAALLSFLSDIQWVPPNGMSKEEKARDRLLRENLVLVTKGADQCIAEVMDIAEGCEFSIFANIKLKKRRELASICITAFFDHAKIFDRDLSPLGLVKCFDLAGDGGLTTLYRELCKARFVSPNMDLIPGFIKKVTGASIPDIHSRQFNTQEKYLFAKHAHPVQNALRHYIEEFMNGRVWAA